MTIKTSNFLFYSGLLLLATGAFGLTFAAFFAIIGLPVFIVGIILILISKKAGKQKIVPIGLFVIVIIAYWPIWTNINTVEPETFLIPNDYRGRVNIIYKKDCGILLEKTDNGLTYKIPNDGILLLSNEQKYGFINHKYYLVDKEGKKTELPKMDIRDFNEDHTLEKKPNEPPRNTLGVFHWGRTGSIGKMTDQNGEVSNKDNLYTFNEFYISTYNDLKEKFNFRYDQKFDSIRNMKIKKCK
ncbi:DUF6843 domain-containing protein [Psychroserpens algicola]|uniref:DUF6843 domain-containing protein n=1 Tax=Psychroserpens algicola TaxID=1719034 RepID=UPI0019544C59|nr:hypothetical protein [Psychroserpens algicola]